MTKKRLTKAQKDAIEKSKLRRRVADIAIGAAGYDFDNESEFATAEFLSRFISGLKVIFGTETNEYLWGLHNLHHWDTIDSSTNALWESGVRV